MERETAESFADRNLSDEAVTSSASASHLVNGCSHGPAAAAAMQSCAERAVKQPFVSTEKRTVLASSNGSVAAAHQSGSLQDEERVARQFRPEVQTFYWHGMQLDLPIGLRLCRWCSLEDRVLEFRASLPLLQKGVALLDSASHVLQYDIVDGALWIKMPSSQFTDMLPGCVAEQLALWEKRNGFVREYLVSGSDGMIYNSIEKKMLVPDCNIFKASTFLASKSATMSQGRVVPTDLKAEVVFECVNATDNVEKTWAQCEKYILTNRAEMAVGICDRHDKKEVMVAYRDVHGDLQSEVMQDPRSIDLGMVLPKFRLYFSYMMPTVFSHLSVHHGYDLRTMADTDLQLLLCSEVSRCGQAANALAMEIINGLGTVNFKDSKGRNPLVEALSARNTEIVPFLLASKANPEYCDAEGVCALLYAKAHNMPLYDTLKSVIGRDVVVDVKDLLISLEKNSPRGFDMCLMASGANMDNIIEDSGSTLLSRALADKRTLWAVRKLVNVGACPTKLDVEGVMPLRKAISSLSEDDILKCQILSPSMDMNVVKSLAMKGWLDDYPRVLEVVKTLIKDF